MSDVYECPINLALHLAVASLFAISIHLPSPPLSIVLHHVTPLYQSNYTARPNCTSPDTLVVDFTCLTMKFLESQIAKHRMIQKPAPGSPRRGR